MSEKHKWAGLIPMVRRFLYGEARPPKAKRYSVTSTPTSSEQYSSMDKDYRWFRQDELVRRCVVINAMVATFSAGFETVLEATGSPENPEAVVKKYGYVKEGIDEYNKQVNLDQALFIAQVKRSIYSRAGFEIVLNKDESPSWLLSLQSGSMGIKPKLNENWELTSYKYEGKDKYQPEEVLYFVNLSIESDRLGLSDIESIRDVCQARHELLRENFPEIVRTLWAPFVILQADTSGMAENKIDDFLLNLADMARAGKSLAVDENITPHIISRTIDFAGLVNMLDRFEQAIHANFGTPRFLVGKPIENRATAYAELEAYVQGTIASIQRYFKREIEAQWYDRWTRYLLEKNGVRVPEDEQPPVLVKHRWNAIRTTDVYEMAKAVAALYGNGLGLLVDHPDKAYDLMGWDPTELEEEE